MTTHFTGRAGVLLVLAASLLLGACASGSSGQFAAADPNKPQRLKTEFTADSLYNVAERLRRSGDYRSALSFYQRARQRAPEDARIFIGMGQALMAMEAPGNAVQTLRHAVKLAPENEAARAVLAKALLAEGQAAEARGHYEWLVSAAPDQSRYYNGLAICLDVLGQHGAAQDNYSVALNLDSENPALRNNLALSFAFAGEYDAALALLSDTMAASRPATRQNLALIHGLAGHMAKAEKIARQDLPADAVANNLKLYERLRSLPSEEQAAIVLLGKSAPKKTAEARPSPGVMSETRE